MDERRYTPRAHLDEGGDRYTNRAALLSSGQEHCERISFHVLVSRMPCSPRSRAQAPPGREQSWRRCCHGEAESSAAARLVLSPQQTSGGQQGAVSWTLGTHTHTPEQRLLGRTASPPHWTLL